LAQVRGFEREVRGREEEVRPYERFQVHSHIGLPGELPDDSFYELDDYKNQGYRQVNYNLRHPDEPLPGSSPARLAISAGYLDHAFDMAVPTSHSVAVYRGARGFLPERITPGTELHDDAYMSTSTDKDVAESFLGGTGQGKIIRITVPAGERMLSYKNLYEEGKLTDQTGDGEDEVLLPRGRTIRVTGVHGNIVEARLLPAEGKPRDLAPTAKPKSSAKDALAKALAYKQAQVAATQLALSSTDDRSSRFVWQPGDIRIDRPLQPIVHSRPGIAVHGSRKLPG
jgi:hypothetical protein